MPNQPRKHRPTNFIFLSAVILSLLAPFIVLGQSNLEENLAAYSIPSVFQVVTVVNVSLEYPKYYFDADSRQFYLYYESANSALVEYIRYLIETNLSSNAIREQLKSVGWSDEDINPAFTIARQPRLSGVKIESFDTGRIVAGGSAFAVSEEGYLITNAHVVEVDSDTEEYVKSLILQDLLDKIYQDTNYLGYGYYDYEIDTNLYNYLRTESTFNSFEKSVLIVPSSEQIFSDEKTLLEKAWPAEIKKAGKAYPGTDAAVLKIEKGKIPALSISTALPKVGERVFAIGFPQAANLTQRIENEATLTSGIVGAIRRSDNDDFDVVQFDASIGSGSSGGPVINGRGEVVGIATLSSFSFFGGGNFNYFLPIKLAQSFLDDLRVDYNAKKDLSISYRQAVDAMAEGKCDVARQRLKALEGFSSHFITRALSSCFEKYQPESGRISSGFIFWSVVVVSVIVGVFIGFLVMFWLSRRRALPRDYPPSPPYPPAPPPSV